MCILLRCSDNYHFVEYEALTSRCCCFVENYIDGREFMQLSQKELKEMIPAVGIVKKLSRLISKVLMLQLLAVQLGM